MDEARSMDDGGAPSGSLAWAGEQTEGRGRRSDRRWTTLPGDALLFTIFWDSTAFRVPTFAFSLTIALGLLDWLDGFEARGRFVVKWPNDVFYEDRDDPHKGVKIAGILTNVRNLGKRSRVHVGIGVNLKRPPGGDYRRPVGGLLDAGIVLTPQDALSGLLPSLKGALEDADPRSRLEPRLWRLGRQASWEVPHGAAGFELVEGVVGGLDAAGGLRLISSSGPVLLTTGE